MAFGDLDTCVWDLLEEVRSLVERVAVAVADLPPPEEWEGSVDELVQGPTPWDFAIDAMEEASMEVFGDPEVRSRIRAIGERLNQEGGWWRMQHCLEGLRVLLEEVTSGSPYLKHLPDWTAVQVSAIWSGIGDWQY